MGDLNFRGWTAPTRALGLGTREDLRAVWLEFVELKAARIA